MPWKKLFFKGEFILIRIPMAVTRDGRIVFVTLLGEKVNLFEADVTQFYLTNEN